MKYVSRAPQKLKKYHIEMKRISTYIFIYIAVLTLAACSRTAMVPESSSPVKEQAEIFPDYRDIIIHLTLLRSTFR